MTQQKQTGDELEWVTEMTSALGLELHEPPRKQDVPSADISLALVVAGRVRRIDVEVVEAIDQATRAGYNGARRLIVTETTAELRRRRLQASVSLMFDNSVLGLIQAQPSERRLMAAKIADLVADTLARPKPDLQTHWTWRSEEQSTEVGQECLGLLSSWGIKFLRMIVVSPWFEPVVLTAAGGPMDSPQLIQDAISKKVEKRARYLASATDAAEVWLLVVGGHCTGSLLPMHVATSRTYMSPFSRTYFLDAGEGRCVRLATTRSSDAGSALPPR